MPADRHKRILIAVSGMSPQIITETLYALITAEQPWLPDEIHLLTTTEGRKNADLQLLHGDGHFHRLLKDYGITQTIRFDDSTIHVIRNSAGDELTDLRTPQDNEAAADCICEKIRELTQDTNTELHVSLAGGRKTMGFYAGYALSLFGRAQDRLSHVLVSEQYESLKDFFYPTPEKRKVYNRDGSPLDAAEAKVWLAPIPFVRLRSFLPDNAQLNRARFSEIVAIVDTQASNPIVSIDIARKQLRIGAVVIALGPRELALYLVFARRVHGRNAELNFPKNDQDVQFAQDFLQALRDIKGTAGDLDASEKALKNGMERAYFDSIKSRLNKSIENIFGKNGALKFQIQSGPRSKSTFFLALDAHHLAIKD